MSTASLSSKRGRSAKYHDDDEYIVVEADRWTDGDDIAQEHEDGECAATFADIRARRDKKRVHHSSLSSLQHDEKFTTSELTPVYKRLIWQLSAAEKSLTFSKTELRHAEDELRMMDRRIESSRASNRWQFIVYIPSSDDVPLASRMLVVYTISELYNCGWYTETLIDQGLEVPKMILQILGDATLFRNPDHRIWDHRQFIFRHFAPVAPFKRR